MFKNIKWKFNLLKNKMQESVFKGKYEAENLKYKNKSE